MSFSPVISITSKSGMVKAISAEHLSGDMGSDSAWYSPNASIVSSLPYGLDNGKKEWLIWERGDNITVKFVPDSNYDNGQGFISPTNALEITVSEINGKVYIIRGKFVTMADNKASAFNNPNRVEAAVNDKLWVGDYILCEKSDADFKVKFSAPESLPGAYAMGGIGQLGLMD